MITEIGNYRILKKLGEGGMGEVFMGEDMMLERKVAIKILRQELSQREDVLQRFRSEAVALGRLNHPNIATVYAFARDGDCYFMAMEFVNGEALDAVISKRGQLPWQEAVRYVCDALAGLEHAHRLNVIHRDIKPSNLMLNYTGEIKLMDFGIARILERARQTRRGYMVGTLEYISPEQAQGLDVDARSDIYSMGAVLYEMVTGRLPFQKNTDYELLQAQIKELPQSPRTLIGDIPTVLENVILKALAKEPDSRFATALDFSKALSSLLPGLAKDSIAPAQTRLSNPLSDAPKSKQGYPFSKIAEQPISQIVNFFKSYPVPVISAFLMALTISFFMLNNQPVSPGNPIQELKNLPFSNSEPEYLEAPSKINPVTETISHRLTEQRASELDTDHQMEQETVQSKDKSISVRPASNQLTHDHQEIPDNGNLLLPPAQITPATPPEESSIKKAETTKLAIKSETSKHNRKIRSKTSNKRKRPHKTSPNDPNIDDWAKDFFRN